ncbi:MAG: MotA/TolQ/ExbB proton channel family protein [Acidobacteria bacterium]|nr:MotA/TolQ/ExbB proton channel family protein [Acidobacteriota bacterium]
MDRGTWLGILLGLALLGVAISLGPNPRIFFHPPSMIVVFGGVIASTFIRFPLGNVLSAFQVASHAFLHRARTSQEVVVELVGISQRARRESLKNLERFLPEDSFLAKGLLMVVDRVERDHIREVLVQELQATQDRHTLGQEIFRFIAAAAPSFGMVGTLIGMVQLFASMKDPQAIGGAMALSLLSTLYGAVVAYLFALPISGKLELRSKEELQIKQLQLDGILGIAAELNPSSLEEMLNAHLAPRLKVRRQVGAHG